jgi:hypothetical protein
MEVRRQAPMTRTQRKSRAQAARVAAQSRFPRPHALAVKRRMTARAQLSLELAA